MDTNLIPPAYTMNESNQSIMLYEGAGNLLTGSQEIYIECKVYLGWNHSPQYWVDFASQQNIDDDSFTIQLPHCQLRCQLMRTRLSKTFDIQYSGMVYFENQNTAHVPFNKIIFHIVNFPKYTGSHISLQNTHWFGRIQLTVGDYVITLDQLPNYPKNLNQREYQITHVGEIRKTNLSYISIQEETQLLQTLTYFLTFLTGSYRSPILPTRYHNDKPIHFVHKITRNYTEIAAFTWFVSLKTKSSLEYIQELNNIIRRIHRDSLKQDTTERIIHTLINWLTEAKNQYVSAEISLMAACAGMEYLYSIDKEQKAQYTKNHTVQPTSNSSDDDSISKKFTNIFVHYKLTDDIPSQFAYIHRVYNDPSFGKLLSKLRNKITHYSPNKLKFMTSQAFSEAKILAIYRLEQIILYKCNVKKTFKTIDYAGTF